MKSEQLEENKYLIEGIKHPILIHSQHSKGRMTCTSAHMHDYIEMLYCTGGSYNIWLNTTPYEFSAGDLVVINSREVHSIFSRTEESGGYICIRILPDLLYTSTASAFDLKYVLPFMLNNSKHQRVFKSSEIENTFIPNLMQELLEEFNKKEYAYELAVKTNISRIFLWIVRYWHSLDIDLSSPAIANEDMTKLILSALDYISKNYSDDIKASEIAQMCHLSYSYFSRIFKQYMKKSFSEYLNYIRMSNAEKLLTSTDLPVTEIASKCGFTNSSYFIKQFREHKGIPPKQFRKMFMQ